jgi:hypothetical protein
MSRPLACPQGGAIVNETPPTAANWLPSVGSAAPGTWVIQGLVALVGWNISLAVLLAVAVYELVVPPVLGVLLLAVGNVVMATVVAIIGWRSGLPVEDSSPDA